MKLFKDFFSRIKSYIQATLTATQQYQHALRLSLCLAISVSLGASTWQAQTAQAKPSEGLSPYIAAPAATLSVAPNSNTSNTLSAPPHNRVAAIQASIVVTSALDNGVGCTLRNAIAAANTDTAGNGCAAGNGADSITFAAGLNGSTITLAGTELKITSTLMIDGGGLITVSGNNASRVFYVSNSQIVTFTGLTIRDGKESVNDGGGIYGSFGSRITINNSTVTSNTSGIGGGIYSYNNSNFTLNNSMVVSNTAAFGGGIYGYDDSSITLNNSTVSANTANKGGGIYGDNSSDFLINNSTIASNTANNGGGIYSNFSSNVTIISSTVASNTAANDGGGIYGDDTGYFTINNSTVVSNTATNNGGGIYSYSSSVTISSSTVASNTAGASGGGIYQDGSFASTAINSSCIVRNTNTAVNYDGNGDVINAVNNWWGNPAGPSGVGPGLGDSVSARVNYTPFLTSAILGCPTWGPEISLSKTVTPSQAAPGNTVTYTLSFSNTGNHPSRSIRISDVMPISIIISSITSSTFGAGVKITQTSSAPNLAWTTGDVPVNGGGVITLTGVISNDLRLGGSTLSNTMIVSTVGELDVTNNMATASVLIANSIVANPPPPPPSVPDFAQKQINEAQVQLKVATVASDIKVVPSGAGATSNKTYEVSFVVQNVSPAAAPAVLASLTMPNNLNVLSVKWEKEGQYYVDGNLPRTCSYDGHTAYCGIGQLWSGMKATVTLRVTAPPGIYSVGVSAEDLSALYDVATQSRVTVTFNLN